jgi:hypothetical protein
MRLPTKHTLYVILMWLAVIAICFFIDRVVLGGQITLTWDSVTDSDLRGYVVEYKDHKNKQWKVAGATLKGTETWIFSGQDGKTYWFRAKSVDFSDNISSPSDVVKEKFPKKRRR